MGDKLDQAVRHAVRDDPLSAELMGATLTARAALWREYCRLHDLVVKIVRRDERCRRFLAPWRGSCPTAGTKMEEKETFVFSFL